MEMWRHGMTASEWHLLLLLAASLVVNFVFSLSSGFRHRYSPVEAASESVTAVALGMIYSFAVLWLIGEVGLRRPWSRSFCWPLALAARPSTMTILSSQLPCLRLQEFRLFFSATRQSQLLLSQSHSSRSGSIQPANITS
jgi:hypothetical protein